MGPAKLLSGFPLLALFSGLSLMVGWLIPVYYDWTDADQSRASPLLTYASVGVLVFSSLLFIGSNWIEIAGDPPIPNCDQRNKFGIRTLLGITALAAFMLAAAPYTPESWACGMTGMFMLLAITKSCIRYPHARYRMAALLATMYFPFVWIVRPEVSDVITDGQSANLIWLPAFVPLLLLCQLVGQHPTESVWMACGLTVVELVIGLCCVHHGKRLAIAYSLAVFAISACGSLGLQMLIRM